jgi:hypothetical protein
MCEGIDAEMTRRRGTELGSEMAGMVAGIPFGAAGNPHRRSRRGLVPRLARRGLHHRAVDRGRWRDVVFMIIDHEVATPQVGEIE